MVLCDSLIGQEFRISNFQLTEGGGLRIAAERPADAYTILLSGETPDAIVRPVLLDMSEGTNVEFNLPPASGGGGSRFFRLRLQPRNAPLDSDGDGLDDIFESGYQPLLNALDPTDSQRVLVVRGAVSIGTTDTTSDGKVAIVDGASLVVDGYHTFKQLVIRHGGVLTHPAGSEQQMRLTITEGIEVDETSVIDASGRGFGGGTGPHPGLDGYNQGGGAGHIGEGGPGWHGSPGLGSGYDSMTLPNQMGSGGGASLAGRGGAGGGVIWITAGGSLDLRGGILADGVAGAAGTGGGSGGSILLDISGELKGNGRISAQGGTGLNLGPFYRGGAGGGGGIAIHAGQRNFTGAVMANGGPGGENGGAGSVSWVDRANGDATLILDNAGMVGGLTRMDGLFGQFVSIRAQGGARVFFDQALVATRQLSVASGATLIFRGNNVTGGDVHVESGGSIIHTAGELGFRLNVGGDLIVDAGGNVTADGLGDSSAAAPGAGSHANNDSGGGGHGGYGGSGVGSGGGSAHDSLLAPVAHGGPGGFGTPGGGAIHLVVIGKVVVNGRVSADGATDPTGSNGFGGGAGGSIWIDAAHFDGTGEISARGGNGMRLGISNYLGGGGGGGRVAIYAPDNTFTGVLAANGGYGLEGHNFLGSVWSIAGGAGTIYQSSDTITQGMLTVANGGSAGAWTDLDGAPNGLRGLLVGDQATVLLATNMMDLGSLTITNATLVFLESSVTSRVATLKSGAVLTHQSHASGVHLVVNTDLTLEQGAAITADGKGYAGGEGPGAGSYVDHDGGGSGGGHGGKGGNDNGSRGGTPGGAVYDDADNPVAWGSGGGGFSGSGGAGGGAVFLNVFGHLWNGGIISASGTAAAPGHGGGAGGSVLILANTLQGDGSVTADGGAGVPLGIGYGGGGGGGRISFFLGAGSDTSLMTIHASGGPGAVVGEDGTVRIH